MPKERALRQIPGPCRLCDRTVRAPPALRMDTVGGLAFTAGVQLVVVTVRVIPCAGCDSGRGILM
ncbi:hypothetical protein L618_004000000330 [Rhodococcus rhodochrous J45]|uniref:Uncharacterized protein n=1 Tax=Rhodococcus rhodochrous J45 TaxID=935266 RepID=A0A562DL19_RHORH|nr:hypothetical protein L618_004000000330 [Rhodococcus rhodochrous J45]